MAGSLLQRYRDLVSSSSPESKRRVLQDITNAVPASINDDQREALVQALLTDIAAARSTGGRPNYQGKVQPTRMQYVTNDAVEALDALVAVKTLGRTPSGSSVVIVPANLEILHSLVNSENVDLAMEAFRCLANALLLNAGDNSVVQAWVSIGGGDSCIRALGRELSTEYAFLACRTLFLLTLKESQFVQDAVESKGIVDVLKTRLDTLFHSFIEREAYAKDALIDISKTVFNLLLNYPRMVHRRIHQNDHNSEEPVMGELFDEKLSMLISPLLQIFNNLPRSPRSPLAPPLTHIIHALINIPVASYADLWFSSSQPVLHSDSLHQDATLAEVPANSQTQGPSTSIVPIIGSGTVRHALELLGDTLSYYIPGDPDEPSVRSLCEREGIGLDDTVAPLVILLTRMAKGNENARKATQEWLLPANLDRSAPLERRADTLGRCLRLLGSVYFPRLKETIGELLFAVCKSDARFMSSQIGYGNAAGFLMNHGIMGPPGGSAETEMEDENEHSINPITGTTSVPTESPFASMTEEEREREAERLFVLFNRLERMGMAVNPVRQAQQEGRLEDVP